MLNWVPNAFQFMVGRTSLLVQPYTLPTGAQALSPVVCLSSPNVHSSRGRGEPNARLDRLLHHQIPIDKARRFSGIPNVSAGIGRFSLHHVYGNSCSYSRKNRKTLRSSRNWSDWRTLGILKQLISAEGAEVIRRTWRASDEQTAGCETGAVSETRLGFNVSTEEKRLFVFGFGYTSCALASYLKRNNWNVAGTCRSNGGRAAVEDCGFHTFLFNSDNDGDELKDDGLEELQQATHWLTSVPPVGDFDRDPVLATHVQDLTRIAGSGRVVWIGYLSSTCVYGDWQGDWVDEETEPRAVKPKAVARLAAENAWLKFGLDNGIPVHIFRLGGIYGPGRSALDTTVRKGPLSRHQQNREKRQFTSRIHVADICQVIYASMRNPCSWRIYNVVDDDPTPRNEVLVFARDLIFSNGSSSYEDGMSSTYIELNERKSYQTVEEKRVSNRRIKQELQVELLHKTYKSGLLAIFENALQTDPTLYELLR